MADRYWVGGTATWDTAAGTKWAATSGGAGGESVPQIGDNVFFDASSGAETVTLGSSRACANLNFTGFTGTFTGSSSFTVAGSITFGAGMTLATSGTWTMNGTGTYTITSNGKTHLGGLTVNSATAAVQLGDALAITGTLTLTSGSFDGAGFAVTVGAFSSSNSSVRELTMGAGQWTLTGRGGTVWNVNTIANFTLTKSALPVSITWTTSPGASWPAVSPAFGATGYTPDLSLAATAPGLVVQSQGYLDFALSCVGNGKVISLGSLLTSAGSTFSAIGDWSGIAGSSSAEPNTLIGGGFGWELTGAMTVEKSSGTFTLQNVAISGLTFSGGATFTATDSFDLGNNSGITITAPSGGGGGTVGHAAFSG